MTDAPMQHRPRAIRFIARPMIRSEGVGVGEPMAKTFCALALRTGPVRGDWPRFRACDSSAKTDGGVGGGGEG